MEVIKLAEKKSAWKIFIIAATLVLLMILYFFVDARYSTVFPRCVFYSITGLYCPGCGSQRAFSSLLHGDVRQAINYNWLFVLRLPLLFYSAAITTLNVFRKKPLVQSLVYSAAFVKTVLALVILFWIARNISCYPFDLLAPHRWLNNILRINYNVEVR